MPLNTDLNVSPYFDDFNANNQYYRILFKPGVAVQAREMTQLQSTLQNQIESFGDWAFKNGDIVSGCTITDIPILPYVRISDYQANGATFDITALPNSQVICLTSNLQARVLFSNTGLQTNYPATNIIYLKYLNTGVNGETRFGNTDQLTFNSAGNTANVIATVNVYPNTTAGYVTTGNAHGIYLTDGVVYLSGTFVKVLTPTYGLVNAYGLAAGNNVVGFQATETIINSNQDQSLLDNALGYPNQNAPGADRLKISPTLVSLDPNTAANTVGFNPIATYNYGSLVSKAKAGSNLYSIVGNAIAKRTYDQSGNFVTNPFVIDTVTDVPSGSLPSIDANTVYGRVNPGSGYALGQSVGNDRVFYINMRRGVDTNVNKQQQITFNYGGYYIVKEVAGTFPFNKAQSVDLYNAPLQAVTNRNFSSLTPITSGSTTTITQGSTVATKIGTAQLRCFTYNSGFVGANNTLYNLHMFNIQMSNGYSASQIASIFYNGSPAAVADVASGSYLGVGASQLFSFGVQGVKNLRDSSNNNNSEYVYRTVQSSSITGTDSNGNTIVTITTSSTGGTDILPYGNGILSTLDAATINLIATANVDTTALSGTVSVSNSSTLVTGSGSTFTLVFNPGDQIKVGSTIKTVNNVVNSTALYVDSTFPSTLGGQTYYKSILNGKIIPIQSNLNNPFGYVTVTNTTSFTITTNLNLQSSCPVNVVFDVMRTTVSPAKKNINKDRFVKIQANTNPLGPWCLGFSDVSQVKAIYGSTTTTFTNANGINAVDLTSNFSFDSGQKDNYYDLGYIYNDGGYSATAYPYLLVQLDYLSTNTSPGVGFFTVESYPIDDGTTLTGTATVYSTTSLVTGNNTSFVTDLNVGDTISVLGTSKNVVSITNSTSLTVDSPFLANSQSQVYVRYRKNTILTKDVPLYIDSQGGQNYLRDYVDFRIPSNPTANDTGSVDTSNAAQIIAAVGYATLNPSNTLSFIVPTNGLNVPSYGRNFQADYTQYLARKDLVYFTPDNAIKVKEGVSSTSPQTPLYPDNGMAVAVLNVPPFPSLSSDQVLQDQKVNQLSKNLIRDTTTAISSAIVTNRAYSMRDIGKLDQRITNLEYYTSLSLLESSATTLTVTDANGLNRFKNGIFVDPFNDFTYSDVSNPEYSIAIDSSRGIARPKFAQETINFVVNNTLSTVANQGVHSNRNFFVDSTNNIQKTGRCLTLPYNEVTYLSQPFATKYRSSAHVQAAWNGSMILLPSFNDNIDLNKSSVNITLDNTTPWKQFASSPFGSIWGPWQTTQSITTNTVVSGVANTYSISLGYFGNGGGAAGAAAASAAAVAAQYAAQGYQIGSASAQFGGGGAFTKLVSSVNASGDTSNTIIINKGNTPNYQNIGAGYPLYTG